MKLYLWSAYEHRSILEYLLKLKTIVEQHQESDPPQFYCDADWAMIDQMTRQL